MEWSLVMGTSSEHDQRDMRSKRKSMDSCLFSLFFIIVSTHEGLIVLRYLGLLNLVVDNVYLIYSFLMAMESYWISLC